MALELLKYIDVDLKWNSVKKGRRNTTRQPRKRHDITAFETNKRVDAPLKKRKVLPAGPQTPSVHYEDDPSQWYHSSSKSQIQKTKSKSRLRNKSIPKNADFSGIKLLADAACSSLIYDKVNDQKVVKEETSPTCMDIKEVIISMESNGSSNQDTLVPNSSHNLHDDGNQKAAAATCSKELRLHWDLNTVMDDWEETCDEVIEKPLNEEIVTAVPLIERCNGDDDSLKKPCVEDLGTKTNTSSKTSDCESCVSKSDVVDKCEDLSTSPTSVLQQESTTVKVEEPVFKSDEQPEIKVKSEEDPTSDCCGSNVTQDDKIQAGSGGYDSPFEDGELREENDNESDNTYKNDSGAIENPLSEEVNHGQTMDDESPSTIPTIVQEDTSEIPHKQHDVEEIDCGSGKESSARKNEPTSDDVCRNVPYVPQSRSSNVGNSYPHSSMRTWDHHRPKSSTRNYGPRMGGDYRRPSASERNNGYYYDNHRASNRYRYHSQDYLDRKVRCSSPKRRSRSRSRSGSPIAWNFQKRKNSDVNVNVDHNNVSHEGLSKSFDERNFTDDTQFRRRVGYSERIKSDDHIRFTQQSGRSSTYKYKDNGYTRK